MNDCSTTNTEFYIRFDQLDQIDPSGDGLLDETEIANQLCFKRFQVGRFQGYYLTLETFCSAITGLHFLRMNL